MADSLIKSLPNTTALTGSPGALDLILLEKYQSGGDAVVPANNTYASENIFVRDWLASLGLTGRNKIINGDFRVDQYAAGAAVTGLTIGGYNACDRWTSFQNIATLTVQQVASSLSGGGNSLKYTVTTTGSAGTTGVIAIAQSIEGFNFADAQWGTANALPITVSFRCKSSVAGTYSVFLRNSAANRYYPVTFTLAANTDTFVVVTILGDTAGTWVGDTNGIGVTVCVCLDAGSSVVGTNATWQTGPAYSTSSQAHWSATNGATFELAQVKVEIGSVPTPFVPDEFGESLRKCQRYYQVYGFLNGGPLNIIGCGQSSSAILFFGFLETQMRAAPTFNNLGTLLDWSDATAAGAVTSIGTTKLTPQNFYFIANTSGAAQYRPYGATCTDATTALAFSAEL